MSSVGSSSSPSPCPSSAPNMGSWMMENCGGGCRTAAGSVQTAGRAGEDGDAKTRTGSGGSREGGEGQKDTEGACRFCTGGRCR